MHWMPEQATLLLPFKNTLLNGLPSIRVGVVSDSRQPVPWVDALTNFLRQIPGIDVHFLPIADRDPTKWKRPAWLADRLYGKSRARFDPFGEMAAGGAAPIMPEAVDAVRTAACDVIIWLARPQHPDVEPQSLAKYGVFTVRFGDRNRPIPFWDEVASNRVTSSTTIFWHDDSFARGRAVRLAETSTVQGLFITANAEQPLVAAIRMLAALCLEIQMQGTRFQARLRNFVVQSLDGTAELESPSNFAVARFIAEKLTRSAQLRWNARAKSQKWFIALRPNTGESITGPAPPALTGFKDVPLPHGVDAMADPFLWEAGGRTYLLFEELAERQSRGRLGCMELLPDGSASEMEIILDRPYHLSYPCVVPQNGDTFLVPETAEAGRVDIYRFSRFPSDLELVASPVEGLALVDTTPVCIDSHWYFFTTTAEPFMETFLFSASRLDGPWTLHPCNPVSSSVRNCRSAGQLFWKNGRLFRPTQDCSVRYGYAIAINEVVRLTPQEFEERPVSYLPPSWTPGLLGTHTWNENSIYQVIDGIRYAK